MNEKEKELLDYLYTVGQQIQDYMRRNEYCKKYYQSANISVYVDRDSDKFDYITANYVSKEKDEQLRMCKKEYDIVDRRSEYTVKEV